MKPHTLLVAALSAFGTSSPVPDRRSAAPSICVSGGGVYDVCDTAHSFIRCSGHDALLIADCMEDKSSYCQIVNGRGHCNGTAPPDLLPGAARGEGEGASVPAA
ncbi:hypothetical protein NUW58_g3076 [Xylaria curta]|uniref:Uncharacterized protein n=1 Tax=Xylaria curta TaxID=42375 RepID=A0ACC1PDK9_9PEZI|nr:hypothetical protein NUW58_g3076 [Xylaria curta]